MAYTSGGWFLDAEFTDSAKKTTKKTFQMTAGDYTAAAADAPVVVAAYAAATDSVVKTYGIREKYGDASIVTPTTGALNSIQALITGNIFGSFDKEATFSIPAPKDAIFGSIGTKAYNVVTLSNALVTAIAALYATGTGKLLISDGEALVAGAGALAAGIRVSRASRSP